MTPQAPALDALARALAGLRPGHTARVAVDGRTAAGKTTLADALGAAVQALGRPVIRAGLDGFHHPRARRYRQGRFSARGYYEDARDLDALRRLLLDPLGPQGDGRFRLESFDLEADRPVSAPVMTAPPGAILILDGSFLQRRELGPCWEAVVFVDVSEAVAAARAAARDGDGAHRLYAERYGPAFGLYEAEADPAQTADAVWNNEDPGAPRLHIRANGRLGA
ncbi:uridylate kinase [Alkalicaulis satelles]|uniref:Uridylate kinase n=1 Tax=Alkalicaulis satelles TaxID=2609175 RepID=A0A5M6ZKW4_9PROT|nr:uridylate kinase [Alkalicaulis satelles]KAA5803858.1 uridylate kinase [Alkalicaulis satelles]